MSVHLAGPRWVVGRTISIYYAFIDGGMAAGSQVWGTVAQKCSLSIALEGSAAALLLVATGTLFPLCHDECGAAINVREQRQSG